MALNIQTVLISESVDPSCAKILSENGVKVTTKVGLSSEELKNEIQHYDGLVVRSATKVTADILAAGKQLKIVGRAGVGVDNIDCDAATKHGVLVINAPGGNTLSAAELTCAMIVSLSRNIVEASASLKSGKWDRKKFMANELLGKTLAIIGLGRIGREVAHRMQSFGMKTIGFDPLVPAEESIKFGVESMELEKIWPLADYITVHTPLIPQTRNMINAEVFSKCPKGVKIINCARGGIVNEDDLFTALEAGQCGGAGLDVYMEEPPKNTKLIQHPKVICTPHLGASTHEAQSRVADEISLQFVDLISGKPAHGIVNSPAFSLSMADSNKPWVILSKHAGALAGALFPSSDKLSLSIKVNGPELNRKESLFSAAALIGILKQRNQVTANFVNAPTLAKENGYEVSSVELQTPLVESTCPVSLTLTVKSASETHSILVCFKGEQPLLCAIDGSGFNNPPVLSHNLIVCKGAQNAIVALLGKLVESGVSSISLSAVSEGKLWCAIHSSNKCDIFQDNLTKSLDISAQLSL
ncbi:D-3-phosphoglycerate dehydrogenase-like [Uloborus diversus]|uniref:D-3-phosphoglycerate dehydrogenase-like n=1 Tax=Uloborus diversus TaxID=327109 RepID=UPI0024096666|nr:D-3-phosphoglycerate dehydrogenase-like [Uloborus diversus]